MGTQPPGSRNACAGAVGCGWAGKGAYIYSLPGPETNFCFELLSLSLPSQVAEFEAKKPELFSCCSLSLPPSLARHGDGSWRRLWLCWVGAAPVPSPPRAPPRCPFPGDTVTCGDGQRHLAPGTGAGQLCYKRNREEATNIGVV